MPDPTRELQGLRSVDLWTGEHRLRMVVALEPPAPWVGQKAPSHSMAVQTGGDTKGLTDLVKVG